MTSSVNAPFFIDTEVIRLTSNGVWMSDETEIDHQNTVTLFFKSIRKDDQGYFLQVSHEIKRIVVEDTAYFVVGLEGTADAGYTLLLSDDTKEPLRPETLKYQEGRLTCQVHASQDEAKFLQKTYMEILKNIKQEGQDYTLDLAGRTVILDRV